jgi:hypothetical protein
MDYPFEDPSNDMDIPLGQITSVTKGSLLY